MDAINFDITVIVNDANQARTCKTKSMSITTTHAQMRPRNIIHAKLHTRDHAQRLLGAGRGRESEAQARGHIT